jgi:hypothetical protein
MAQELIQRSALQPGMAFSWKLVGPPGFPFFLVLTIALGFQFALLVYHVLLRLLSR